MKKAFFVILLFLAVNAFAQTNPKSDPPQSEFADASYVDRGQQMIKHFVAGNMDQFMDNFADNAVFSYSNGDSLVGRSAIGTHWKDRRNNLIRDIRFTNDIWLPIKVNKPQQGPDMPGIWLLHWHQVNVTYKNGNSLEFWVHSDYHFNGDNKVDRWIQYIDLAPIKAASGRQ